MVTDSAPTEDDESAGLTIKMKIVGWLDQPPQLQPDDSSSNEQLSTSVLLLQGDAFIQP